MKILALDTSTPIASVALTDGERVLAEFTLDVPNHHTAQLIPLIHETLTSTQVGLREVDGFAVGLGPGSFTGVRIGVSTIKSLAYASRKPVVGICTLDVIALNLRGAARPVGVLLDARRNEVYAAVYHPPLQRQSKVLCVSVEQLATTLSQPCLLVGSGVMAYRKAIERAFGARAECVEPALGLPRAALLSQLARPRFASGKTDDPMKLTPLYVRRPEAERQLETGQLGSQRLVDSPRTLNLEA